MDSCVLLVRRAILLFAVVAASVACSDSAGIELQDLLLVPRDVDAAFQTDSLQYTLPAAPWGHDLRIGFTFKNPTGSTVYVINCRALWTFHVEKYENGAWIRAYSPTLPGCLAEPIVIAPASEARGTIRIVAGYPESNIYPKFDVSHIAGVYRIVWKNVVDSWNGQRLTWGSEIPDEYRVSNRFVLFAAPR